MGGGSGRRLSRMIVHKIARKGNGRWDRSSPASLSLVSWSGRGNQFLFWFFLLGSMMSGQSSSFFRRGAKKKYRDEGAVLVCNVVVSRPGTID